MKTRTYPYLLTVFATLSAACAADISLESAPPVVVKTEPVAGATRVDPRTSEIVAQFSKVMTDGSWSWSTWGEENFPEMNGQPKYAADKKTCVLPVKLQPGKFYAIWLNSEKFKNFKDASGQPAVPYLLTFTTAEANPSEPVPAAAPVDTPVKGLNADQLAVLAWTDRQFRSFFDARTFEGWSDAERSALETKLIDSLKGPQSRDYFQAINTLGAMRSTKGLSALRAIAYDRADKNNRDRWMAIRSLGMIGDKADVPELIHLVYHGNVNTRWWAQISLVRITGQNFGKDWNAWGKWWKDQKGEPPYKSEIIRWWNGQPESDKLAQSLDESDARFLADVKGKPASTQKNSSGELASKLKAAEPTMNGIRDNWTATMNALDNGDNATALAAARRLMPHIQDFSEKFRGTSLEAGSTKALDLIKSLTVALEKEDQSAVAAARSALATLGQSMEKQIKAIAPETARDGL